MIVLHPSSNCDICLESYVSESSHDARRPSCLPCGHVFCDGCLSSLQRPICPYCRQPFRNKDGKVVHMHAEFSESDWHRVPGSQEDQRAQQFQRQISRTVDGAGVVSDTMQELISTATEWLRSKPSHLYEDLRLTIRLLTWRRTEYTPQTHTSPIAAPAKLICRSDWGMARVTSPRSKIYKDPRAPDSVYENVSFTGKSIMWGRPHAHEFREVEIPFCIIGSEPYVDIVTSHGRDRSQIGDHRGELTLEVRHVRCANGYISENAELNEVLYGEIPLFSAPYSMTMSIDMLCI